MQSFFFLLTLFSLIAFSTSLPITEDISLENDTVDIFMVQVDRLAQVIATHLQFDHLDTVISSADKEIATEFQHHIQISIESDSQLHQTEELPTLDMMDLEILKSQIFAAIQAHTEGNLPLTWDRLADQLSRQAIESYLRQSLMSVCSSGDSDVISSECLSQHAAELANQLDQYILQSLTQVFEILDQTALPDLLQHTAKDLKGILNYFNSVFLQDGTRKFVLQVIPWNTDSTDIHSFKSRLLDMAVHPSYGETSHSVAFFIDYAPMARV
ncbi:hypothetical protein EDC96DRAFT_501742 [Choanephora cucurbitarum]|nr:hypothetical protein EDC96DRAFT_501742 [Choanephora cucurbitarum]